MRTRTTRAGTTLRLAVGLLAVGLSAAAASAQIAGTNAEVAGCVTCHYGADQPGARRFVADFKSQDFVKLSESKTWEASDPHARAFEQILPEKNPVAKKMQELLGAGKPAYKVAEDYRCLTCHATDTNPKSSNKRVADEFVARDSIGVGCNACHGVKDEWQNKHWAGATVADGKDENDKPVRYLKWRVEKADVKEAAGMRTLRDPNVKADLCASCHVGNAAENKVVTHEIYAAGHPPLPPLELLTFMDDEPRHWGYPSELKFLSDFAKNKPQEVWEVFRFKPEGQDNYFARHLAAGATASLKAEMNLLEWEANRAAKDGDGLDFARFDCYSCHHELKYPSARQERGYGERVPGRPPLKAWTAALPLTVSAHAGTLGDDALGKLGGQFPAAWAAVSKSAAASPFAYGKGADVAKSAKAVGDWTTGFAKALEKANYSDAAADQLLAEIGQAATNPVWYGDTEATMHLTWAYRSLGAARKKDVAKLDELKGVLPLQLREPKELDEIAKANPDWKGPIPAGKLLPKRQALFANFDPKQFIDVFNRTRLK